MATENWDKDSRPSSAIYLGHIPHGFYEKEMRSYFSQFGDVNRLRLARSAKTGRSKGYAFIEFNEPEVAKIAAETMNNYLLFGQLLVCKQLPAKDIHPDTFKGANRKFVEIPWTDINRNKFETALTDERKKELVELERAKREKRKRKLVTLGICDENGEIIDHGNKQKRKDTVKADDDEDDDEEEFEFGNDDEDDDDEDFPGLESEADGNRDRKGLKGKAPLKEKAPLKKKAPLKGKVPNTRRKRA